MKRTHFSRLASAVLATLMLVSCIVALPVSASSPDINYELPNDLAWKLDPAAMKDPYDNLGSTDYTLTSLAKRVQIVDFQGEKVFAVLDTSNDYRLVDTNCVLGLHETFVVSVDMYFESFPYGEKASYEPDVTANDYPVSLISWVAKDASTGIQDFKSVRLDGEGYMCKKANNSSRTDVQLPLKEWVNLRLVVSSKDGNYEFYMNDQLAFSDKFKTSKAYSESIIRILDGYYKYTVYFKNFEVYTNNSYKVGLTNEESADYLAHQTTKVENGTFDLRLLAGMDTLNYGATGYEVSVLTDKNGTVSERSVSVKNSPIYSAVNAAGKQVSAESLGTSYLSAATVTKLDASANRIELAVRPYTVKQGSRVYGTSKMLVWQGKKDSAGHPVFTVPERAATYVVSTSGDTYIRQNEDGPHGNETTLRVKNNGETNAYTRYSLLKFDFNEAGMNRLDKASRVYLEFYVQATKLLSEEEKAAGGVLGVLYGTHGDWDEKTLVYEDYKESFGDVEEITQFRYTSGGYVSVDVSEYVYDHAYDGTISFLIQNVENDGNSDGSTFHSSSGANPPRLTVYPLLHNHEITLNKTANQGYEPWSYAEEIVNKWFTKDYAKLYANEPFSVPAYEKVDNSKPTGDYTYYSPFKSGHVSAMVQSKVYIRTLDTLKGYDKSKVTPPTYDTYGGVTNAGIKGEATGYFHMEQIGGRHYIMTPLGNPFFTVGMNTVELGATDNQDEIALLKYGTAENYYKEISEELRSFGINTVYGGDWKELIATGNLSTVAGTGGGVHNYMSALGLTQSNSGAYFIYNNTFNAFDPDFVTYSREKTAANVEGYQDNPYIMGWTSDNELPHHKDLLIRYLTIEPDDPRNAFSYATAWTFLKRATGLVNPSVDDVTDDMMEEFKAMLYNRYYEVITEALRASGAKQMYLGNRINGDNYESEGYLRAAAKHLDALTANLYGGPVPNLDRMATMYRYSGLPFIVTEFYAKAQNALDMNGIPLMNQNNAGWVVETQEDRGAHYESYVLEMLESNMCVGWVWYRFRDNDQRVYRDNNNFLYVDHNTSGGAISSYVKVGKLAEDGSFILDEDFLGVVTDVTAKEDPYLSFVAKNITANDLTTVWKGEYGGDNSNNGSNKGLYDNYLNVYQPLADSYTRMSEHLFGLIDYFDNH